jgi:hypothetical protein
MSRKSKVATPEKTVEVSPDAQGSKSGCEESRAEELCALRQLNIKSSSLAAVRATLAFRQALLVRSRLGVVLATAARQVVESSDAAARGLYVPASNQFDLSENIFDLGLADTRAARAVLGLLTGQVRALHEAVEASRSANPVATFRSLRAVSRGLLTDPDEEVRSAWGYVLQVWRQFSTELPKIAAWQPSLDKREEVKLSFDEATGAWKPAGRDGTESTAEVKAAYAVAR